MRFSLEDEGPLAGADPENFNGGGGGGGGGWGRLDPEAGVNKFFQNASCQGRIQKFFQGEGIKFRPFFKRNFFPTKLF